MAASTQAVAAQPARYEDIVSRNFRSLMRVSSIFRRSTAIAMIVVASPVLAHHTYVKKYDSAKKQTTFSILDFTKDARSKDIATAGGTCSQLAWQPDGNQIAAVTRRRREGQAFVQELVLLDLQTGASETVASTGQRFRSIEFSGDGRHLCFTDCQLAGSLFAGDSVVGVVDTASRRQVCTIPLCRF